MKSEIRKNKLTQRRRWRIRRKVRGVSARPRLTVRFTARHIHAQCIDDTIGKTLVGLSTQSKDLKSLNLRANVASATEIGKVIGEKARQAGIEKVVFDRAGRRYHGCVKAFADAAREAGLSF